MSDYQRNLRLIRLLMSIGFREEAKIRIEKLAPLMLPSEMNEILYRTILIQDAEILKFCYQVFSHSYLSDPRFTKKMSLIHVAVEFGTKEILQIILETKIYNINAYNSIVDTALVLAFQRDEYAIMSLLLKEGATLYPIGKYTQYIQTNILPRKTPSLLIAQIVRERRENRDTNPADIRMLKNAYPTFFEEYKLATLEWIIMNNTAFIKGISLRDLVEKPTNELIEFSRSATFHTAESKIQYHKFPNYGSMIQYALKKLIAKREDWEKQEVELEEITFNQIPSAIIERISFYLTIK